jgi:alanyl-tRNA synthetase
MPVLATTSDEAGAVLHWVDDPEGRLTSGMQVECSVAAQRRRDHMQQHSAQHLLSQAFQRLFGWETVGFHLGSTTVTIDLTTQTTAWDKLLEAEELANRIVFQDVQKRVTTYQSLEEIPEGLRGSMTAKEAEGEYLRVVSFGEFDSVPCGGTHVASSGQLGLIKVLDTETMRSQLRVHFAAGWRALEHFEELRAVAAELGELLTTGLDDFTSAAERLISDRKQAEKRVRALESELDKHRARQLLNSARTLASGNRVIAAVLDCDMSRLQALATRLTAEERTVVLLAGITGNSAQFVFGRAETVDVDCSEVLGTALPPFGGRGGGSPARAQGGGVAADDAEAVLEKAKTHVKNTLRGEAT